MFLLLTYKKNFARKGQNFLLQANCRNSSPRWEMRMLLSVSGWKSLACRDAQSLFCKRKDILALCVVYVY